MRRTPDDRCHRQSKGRRREDHHRHQPGCRARPEGQANTPDRSRPASQQLDVVPRRRRGVEERVRRDFRAERQLRGRHPPVDAPEPLRRPVADRAGQARSEAGGGVGRAFPAEGPPGAHPRAVSQHRHRLPADAGPPHRERAGGGDAPADSDPVVVLRARGHGRPAGNDREGPGARQSRLADPGRRHHDARQAHGAGARHPIADRQGVREQGLQHRHHEERPARREPGLQGIHLYVRTRVDRRRRVLPPVRGGHGPCLSEDCQKPFACATTSTTSRRSPARLAAPSGG